jgi:ATP-dependent 26S proteasome regulatory subunit
MAAVCALQVGGLDGYISALKEMVFLPLVYPELFARFNLSPPRGVLFYGPPGKWGPCCCRRCSCCYCRWRRWWGSC